MSWDEDVRGLLAYLDRNSFKWDDLTPWFPWLERMHPGPPDARTRLQATLSRWEQRGELTSIGEGTWRRRAPLSTAEHLDLGLSPGEETTRDDIAELIGMKGPAALRRGMFKPASGPFQDHLLLFHDPHQNPYGDIVGDYKIHYVGQGRTDLGDQRLDSYNLYLAEHLKRGLTVHFFTKVTEDGTLRYDGEVLCEGVRRLYRPEEERSVLDFELVRLDPLFTAEPQTPHAYYRESTKAILAFGGEPRFVDRVARVSYGRRLIRDIAFRDVVIEAYGGECAVCGRPLKLGDLSELQAAHIVGVAERGPDEPRNGLSLCVRHHWAFDNGIFSLTDRYEVLLFLSGDDPHGELDAGEPIQLPSNDALYPHPWYLQYHRGKWGPAAA